MREIIRATVGGMRGPGLTDADEARLDDVLNRAEIAAAKTEGIADSIIPLGTAVLETLGPPETIYQVTAEGFDPAVPGRRFSFVVPATSTDQKVGIRFNGLGRKVFMPVGQRLREGWIAIIGDNLNDQWRLIQQIPSGVTMVGGEADTKAGLEAARLVSGTDAIMQPLDGNPNELFANISGYENDDAFTLFVIEANTASPILNTADGRRYAITQCPAGTLQPGDHARIVFSGGVNNFIYRGKVTDPDDGPDLVAEFQRKVRDAQWAPSGTPTTFAITTAGSSVTTEISSGREGATDYAPSHRLIDALNGYTGAPTGIQTASRIPGTRFIDDNWSHGGHTIGQFEGQINESPYWQAGTTRALLYNPGPNDFRVSQYGSNQTLPGGITVLEARIMEAKERGIPVFMTTPFDPDVSQENYAGFYTNEGKGIPQAYPYAAAAPVNPETQQYPPASQSVGTADMTGNGIPIPFDRRFEHGAALIRALAAKYPKVVVLIDSRRAFHRAVEALMPGAYEKRVLYGTGDPIHPLRYAHDRGFGIPIAELAQDILAGRPLKRVYEGLATANYGA